MTSLYNTVETLHAALQAIAARSSGALTFRWLADDEGAQLALLHTHGRAVTSPSRRLRALVLFGEHAREAITSEVALRLVSLLAGEASSGDALLRRRAALLREHVELALLPLVNVRGRRLFERGDFCRRGNGRNVDLNRNWPTPGWGGRETEHSLHDCDPGPAPLSEPETRAVAAWARAWRPDIFLCVHSGQLKLLTPLAHTFALPPDHAAHERVIRALNLRLRVPLPWSRVGRASTGVGYVSRGTSLDWFYLTLNVSAAFAFEIGEWPTPLSARRRLPAMAPLTPHQLKPHQLTLQQGMAAMLGDGPDDPSWCLHHFNPSGAAAIEQVVADWSAAVLTLVACAADDVAVCGPDIFGNDATANDTFSGLT